jgi:cytochrome c biogenesis protein CcdA
MKALRIFAKILLFPFSLLLTIFVAVSMFVVERCAGILNILSGIIFLGALAGYAQYLFGWPIGTASEATTLQLAIFATVFAFILSPYGLPMLAVWILAKLENLNDAIKAI